MLRTTSPNLLAFLIPLALVGCGPGTPESAPQASTSTEKPAPSASEPAAAAARGALMEMQAFIASKAIDRSGPKWRTSLPKPPQLTFQAGETYYWLLKTSEGPIKIRLMPEIAPMHVSSTIFLTELGFYDGILFHRVIPGFMAQGGDPLGVGSGGPGYQYSGEFSPAVRHTKPGLLSMANRGPGTDGSQFFLTFVATPHLDDKHTIFGEIVEGMDALKKLESFGGPGGTPKKQLSIETARIVVE